MHLIHLTAPNIRVCHALAFDFLALTLTVPPSSKKSNLLTALHSYLGKRLCSLTKGFQSTPECGDTPRGYYFAMFCYVPCGEVWHLVEDREGNWHSIWELVLGREELLETGEVVAAEKGEKSRIYHQFLREWKKRVPKCQPAMPKWGWKLSCRRPCGISNFDCILLQLPSSKHDNCTVYVTAD